MEEEHLIDIMDDLVDEEFNSFKWHLKKETWNGMEPIKPTKLQSADRMNLVDLMIQKYQETGAVQVVMNMFKKINRNDLVNKLGKLCPAAEETGPNRTGPTRTRPCRCPTCHD
uniref:Pyrin domain-containing protein n=1 Tax=Poecilia latipinna TaxID=48699 RepID=A0A3B3VV26_9TELE